MEYLKRVPNVIYVYSGKGGVGKSTVCVNLAYSFLLNGIKTGIFDADLSGPSIPSLVKNIEDKPPNIEGVLVVPGDYKGVKINSSGFICSTNEDSYLQGKYLQGALYQLLFSVNWDVDVLVVDLPPGTSNIHKEIFVNLPGKVLIVTTPQYLSYADTMRSIDFIKRLDMDILGILENMSYYKCNKCNAEEKIFDGKTKEKLCKPLNIKLLAELPLDKKLNEFSNQGIPYVLANKNTDLTSKYLKLARDIYSSYQSEEQREELYQC